MEEAPTATSIGPSTVLLFSLFALAAICVYGLAAVEGELFGVPVGPGAATLLNILAMLFAYRLSTFGPAYYLLALLLFQNSAVGLFLSDTASSVPISATEQKSVAIALYGLLASRKIAGWLGQRRTLAILITSYALWVAVHIQSLDTAGLSYARNFTLLPLLLITVLATTNGAPDRRATAAYLGTYAGYVLGVGSLIEICVSSTVWRDAIHVDLFENIHSISAVTEIGGVPFRRVGGFVVQTTNAGYLAASAVLLLVMSRPPSRTLAYWIALSLAALALFLSAAKNGVLLLIVAAVVTPLVRRSAPAWITAAAAWVFASAAVAVNLALSKGPAVLLAVFPQPLSILGGDSTTYHVAGLVSGITEGVLNPIGFGVGAGGNFGAYLTEESSTPASWIRTGSESSWGVMAYQLGAIGLVLFLSWIVAMMTAMRGPGTVLLAAWSAALMYHEALLGPQAGGLLILGAALLSSNSSGHPQSSIRTTT